MYNMQPCMHVQCESIYSLKDEMQHLYMQNSYVYVHSKLNIMLISYIANTYGKPQLPI